MAWSISLVILNLDQLAFFRLKRLLKGKRVAVTGDLMVIVIGRCRVHGMGSNTPLWHIEAILVLTNATYGLYPLFHRALSKHLGSFASWMREKLKAPNSSTRSPLPSFSYPHAVLCELKMGRSSASFR